jgi:hypothetical protein
VQGQLLRVQDHQQAWHEKDDTAHQEDHHRTLALHDAKLAIAA